MSQLGIPSSFAEQLLDVAQRQGAQAAEVFSSQAYNCPVLYEANRLKQLESRRDEGVALRLWKDSRPGLAVAHGVFDPHLLVDTALSLSQLNQPEDLDIVMQPSHRVAHRWYGQAVDVQQLVAWGNAALAQLCKDQDSLQCLLELDCEQTQVQILNTAGLNCAYSDVTLSIYGAVEWTRGEDFLTVEEELLGQQSLEIPTFVKRIHQRLDWAQERALPPVGPSPVLFTGKAAELLWTTVEAALNGKRVLEGASPWSDRLLDQVLAPNITLQQRPETGPFRCPFDDEGILTRSLDFIKEGTLQLFYTDKMTGALLGSGSTGHGLRPDLADYPSPSLFQLIVQPGTASFVDLLKRMGDGIVVDQVIGQEGGISGDFAVNVDLGYRVKNGEIVGRIKDTLISGNAYEALSHAVVLGNDAAWYGACCTPSVLVEQLSITA